MSSKNFAQHNSVFLKYLCLQCPPLLLYEHLRLSFHSAKNSQIQQKFLGWGVGAFNPISPVFFYYLTFIISGLDSF